MAAPMSVWTVGRYLRISPFLFRSVGKNYDTSRAVLISQTGIPLGSGSPQAIHTSSIDRQEESPEKKLSAEEEDGTQGKRGDVDVETSIRYLKSRAYKVTYGDVDVWVPYRRNYKGHFMPHKTRKTCIRGGEISTGNPCPICRDKYLVVHSKNLDLLKQFISPLTGQLISYNVTGVCQRQHKNLLISIMQAWDEGTIEMPIPHRKYDYKQYYSNDLLKANNMM